MYGHGLKVLTRSIMPGEVIYAAVISFADVTHKGIALLILSNAR